MSESLLTLAKPRRLIDLIEQADIRPREELATSDVEITSLTDDSRAVLRGSCFVAVRGSLADGHRFVEDAITRGASAVIVESPVSFCGSIPIILVNDSRSAVARLAGICTELSRRDGHGLPLVGITGTNGKTTVAWMLRSILRAAGHRPSLFGTIEYDLIGRTISAPLTTPGAIHLCRLLSEAADAGATHGVLEVSSHALDQRRSDGLKFETAVFTNLSGDHIDYHKTTAAYLAAKCRLFEGLGSDSHAVVNLDDPSGRQVMECTNARVTTFSLANLNAACTAVILDTNIQCQVIRLQTRNEQRELRLPLIGRHNVENALAAAAAAQTLNVDHEVICRGLENLQAVPGRLERASPPDCPFTVLIDYAHTDDALDNALRSIKPLTSGRLICVFGCGGDRDRTKRPRMAATAGRHADVAIVTSDNPRTENPRAIMSEIETGFSPADGCRVKSIVDRREAVAAAIECARANDVILVAGKGHEDYQIIGDDVMPFNDRSVVRDFLGTTRVTVEGMA